MAAREGGHGAATRLDEIFAADAKADCVLVGDFNDEPDNVSLKDHLRSSATKDNLPAGSLYDTTALFGQQQRHVCVE